MIQPPVRYTADVETIAPDETDTVAELNATFDTILERTAADYGHAVRAVHAKAHGLLRGEMTIDADLPPELAQGLFAQGGTHSVVIRLSTNAGDVLPDVISLPRGLALKVLDVAGERLSDAPGSEQDFLMVNGPVFLAPTAEKFLGNLKLLAKTTDRIEGTKKAASAVLRGVRHAFEAVGAEAPAAITALGGAPNVEPLGETYYSTTPFRYGDHIAKFSLAPLAPAMRELTGREISVDGRDDAIREDVRAEMAVQEAVWEFRVQLCRDLARQPIEDATVRWDEAEAPFQRVAIVRAPVQDSWDAATVAEIDACGRFSVWNGLAAHRPLGNVNRARQGAYRHSADFRARVNGCPMHGGAAG